MRATAPARTRCGANTAARAPQLKAFVASAESGLKANTKSAMQFASFVKGEAEGAGRAALQLRMPFDEAALLQAAALYEQVLGLGRLLPIDPRPGTVPPSAA